MARYATLIRFTDQGSRDLGKSVGRAGAFKAVTEKAGVTVETQLWTAGACDGILVLSGDENKILRCLAQLVALGNVRTETMRAFDAGEFKAITR